MYYVVWAQAALKWAILKHCVDLTVRKAVVWPSMQFIIQNVKGEDSSDLLWIVKWKYESLISKKLIVIITLRPTSRVCNALRVRTSCSLLSSSLARRSWNSAMRWSTWRIEPLTTRSEMTSSSNPKRAKNYCTTTGRYYRGKSTKWSNYMQSYLLCPFSWPPLEAGSFWI